VCYSCGRKQLRDPETGYGFGKFGHNLDELIRAAREHGFQPAAEHKLASQSRMFRHSSHAKEEVRTVLVFRNGQRREIREYTVQRDTILVFTKRGIVRVPAAEIDIPSTQTANARRGIQFRLCA